MRKIIFICVIVSFSFLSACERKETSNSNPAVQQAALPAPALAPTSTSTSESAPVPSDVKPMPGNILVNPSFESGAGGWFWMEFSKVWNPFDISDQVAHSGKKSAYLRLDDYAGNEKIVHGVVQSMKPTSFPKMVSGWYRIDNWNRGADIQYLQFVVIAWEPMGEAPNYQIRYVLEGVKKQPLNIANARYVILTKTDEPETNKWLHFEVPIRDDFQRLWGKIPKNYEKLNFFFEARHDGAIYPGKSVRADVYYDDLYVGNGE